MIKNTAGQKVLVFAKDEYSLGKTGDAANITAYISKDGAAPVQSNDVNPAELDAVNMPGIYVFDLTQAETNCNDFILYAKSSTADVTIEPINVDVATDTVTALKAATGFTAGNTWTFAKLCKVLAAFAAGKWQDKAGVSGTYEILDADDGTTVVAEEIPSETSPHRTDTIL